MKRIIYAEENTPKTNNSCELKGIMIRDGKIRLRVAHGYRDPSTTTFSRNEGYPITLTEEQSNNLIGNSTDLADLITRSLDFIANNKSGTIVDD